jgi:hypothetical protein
MDVRRGGLDSYITSAGRFCFSLMAIFWARENETSLDLIQSPIPPLKFLLPMWQYAPHFGLSGRSRIVSLLLMLNGSAYPFPSGPNFYAKRGEPKCNKTMRKSF